MAWGEPIASFAQQITFGRQGYGVSVAALTTKKVICYRLTR